MNKLHELKIAIELYNVNVVCITETHLTHQILDCEILLENFRVFRQDRKNGKKGGGSCIFVHKTIDAQCLENFDAPDTVGLCLNLNNHVLKLICLYRSQNLSPAEQNLLMSEVDKLHASNNEELLLVGDFNFTDVNWDSFIVNCNESTVNNNLILQRQYLDIFSEKGLLSFLKQGTVTRRRIVDNVLQESHLDQVLCSNQDIVLSTETVSPLGKSDHLGVLVDIKLKNNIEYIQTEKQNWSKFSVSEIETLGEHVNWEYSSSNLSSNEMWTEISSKLNGISAHAPKVRLKCTKNGEIISKAPWDSTSLKRRRKEKDKAWKIFDNLPTPQNLGLALQKQEEFEKKQIENVCKYEKKIVNVMKSKPKVFYKYLNSKRKVRECVSSLKNTKGETTKCPSDAANLLGRFFASTFTDEPHGPLEESCYKVPDTLIGDISITHGAVKKLLSKLEQSKSMGPDNIHPKLLAVLAKNNNFVNAVTLLFQKSYDSGQMPQPWKSARVTALHKKGSKTDPSHYRPISLTCILCKVYENILRTHIHDHVLAYLSKVQHGFVAKRSCLSNLLEAVDLINDMLANGENVDIFYLDFQKAFDTVPHYRLIEKLKSFGIVNKTLDMVSDFLSNRTFKVSVGNSFSEEFEVTSGVPQGSVLGPLLFVLYINDLPENLKSFVSLFADDVKMYANANLKQQIQEDLDQLSLWQNKWLLHFNIVDKKCKVMHIGRSNPQNVYFLDNSELPVITSEKDLGVMFTDNWNWEQHINSIVNKALSSIAWVLRTVISRSPDIMLQIYKSMIRPHLEYCVQLWSPLPSHGNWSSIMAIENVQRSFTRAIDGIGLLSYGDRLKKLGLTTLLERRTRGDLIETFRILSGKADYGKSFYKVSQYGRNLISRPGDQSRYKHSFLSRRVISYWNKLPALVKSAENVNQFKNRLDTFREKNFGKSGHFWELSNEIFLRINETNRSIYRKYMVENPTYAKIRNVNLQQ